MKPLKAMIALAAAIGGMAALSAQDAAQIPGAVDPSRVTAGDYRADPAHTLIGWRINHFGFNDYLGLFGAIDGTLQIDPAAIGSAKLDVTVPIGLVTVASAGLRDHLLRAGKGGGAPDFFGPDPAPARFVSTQVRQTGETTAEITGELTLNGVTLPVIVDARFTGAGANPYNRKPTIGFAGTATINRSDFGITFAVPMVADQVDLEISAAFEKE